MCLLHTCCFNIIVALICRSELHNPIVTVRFGLLLETYLKVSPDHLNVLYKQFDALNKLNAVSQLIKLEKNVSRDEVCLFESGFLCRLEKGNI
jgi:hypothetical protein